jgi:hypothetical protein
MKESNTGKLYFLRDRGRRPPVRPPRRRPDAGPAAQTTHGPSAQETIWLARVLCLQGAYLILYWVAISADLISPEFHEAAGGWLYSALPADLFVAAAAGVGGYDLLSRPARRDSFVLLASGGLIFLSLQRLAFQVTAGMHRPLAPGERLAVTAMGVSLCVGIWALSHSLRQRAERS